LLFVSFVDGRSLLMEEEEEENKVEMCDWIALVLE